MVTASQAGEKGFWGKLGRTGVKGALRSPSWFLAFQCIHGRDPPGWLCVIQHHEARMDTPETDAGRYY